jgi:hypothetical protein
VNATTLTHVLDVLAADAPSEVARGRAALEEVLGWTASSCWQDVVWSFSDLAGGAPVELVWRPGRTGLFWTAEPAAPELPTAARTDRALRLAHEMGFRLPSADIEWIHDLIGGSPSPWPIWLGGRHDPGGDTCKLYVRTSALSDPAMRGGDHAVMLGLAANGDREVYWRRPARYAGDRWRLTHEADLADLVALLDAALVKWTGHGLDAEGARGLGLSLRRSRSGRVEALTAFLHMRDAGNVADTRRRLLEAEGSVDCAAARLWAEGWLEPLGLSLAASSSGVHPSLGFRPALARSPA